jgi:hypothetical protein
MYEKPNFSVVILDCGNVLNESNQWEDENVNNEKWT